MSFIDRLAGHSTSTSASVLVSVNKASETRQSENADSKTNDVGVATFSSLQNTSCSGSLETESQIPDIDTYEAFQILHSTPKTALIRHELHSKTILTDGYDSDSEHPPTRISAKELAVSIRLSNSTILHALVPADKKPAEFIQELRLEAQKTTSTTHPGHNLAHILQHLGLDDTNLALLNAAMQEAGSLPDTQAPSFLALTEITANRKYATLFERNLAPYDFNTDRWKNILPFSDNCLDSDEGRLISGSLVHLPGLSRAFIACAAPVWGSIYNFRKVLKTHYVQDVIVVTSQGDLQDGQKILRYWPDAKIGAENVHFQVIRIEEGISKDPKNKFPTYKIMTLRMNDQSEVRLHLYSSWNDFSATSIVDLVPFMKAVDRHLARHNHPCVIHCSAGVGRTGTYLAAYSAMHPPKQPEGQSDPVKVLKPAEIVTLLRAQRIGMVQTPEQFAMIEALIKEFSSQ